MPETFDLPIKTVTCRTEGCESEGYPLTLPCADFVVCGACSQTITDVVAVD